jgi:serine/threonine-protein kinase SRPK1
MAFEVLGQNLYKIIQKSNFKGIPLENVKIITKQVFFLIFF